MNFLYSTNETNAMHYVWGLPFATMNLLCDAFALNICGVEYLGVAFGS